jgi:hypothetical protein
MYATVHSVGWPPWISYGAATVCITRHWQLGQPNFGRPATAPEELAFLALPSPLTADLELLL